MEKIFAMKYTLLGLTRVVYLLNMIHHLFSPHILPVNYYSITFLSRILACISPGDHSPY
jgi:hypothetical protein